MHKEMEASNETVPEDEKRMFDFMKNRSDAFEKNELEPDSMKKLMDELNSTRRKGVAKRAAKR